MQILWPSRLCDCSFVLEFDPGRDTLTRPYRAVSWGPDEEVIETGLDEYPIVTATRRRDACPVHDQDDHEAAFQTVLAEHVAAGHGEDYRKIVVNGWTAPCGCVTTSQFHRDGVTGHDPTASMTRIVGPVLRRCDAHQRLEGVDVFRQVRRESVEVALAWVEIEKLLLKERRWTRPDGGSIWERDLPPGQGDMVRLILGEPELAYRDPPEVGIDHETGLVRIRLPKTASEIVDVLRAALPAADIVLGV